MQLFRRSFSIALYQITIFAAAAVLAQGVAPVQKDARPNPDPAPQAVVKTEKPVANLPSETGKGGIPAKFYISKVPHVRQKPDFCGPASLSMVLGYWGKKVDQQTIAKDVFDPKERATTGYSLIDYARNAGFMAYSFNSDPRDLKEKLAAGVPVIVEQYFAPDDNTYHFRVVVGYNDADKTFVLSDPEEDAETKISYDRFARLWKDFGNYALLVVPKERDRFAKELDETNPVFHMDLAMAYEHRNELQKAQAEAKTALGLDPGNPAMIQLLAKTRKQLLAAGKQAKVGK